MSTKEKLLQLLETRRGDYFSGEELAKSLEVSRAAVWKAVNALRKDGYSIEAVTNRGYSLASDTDILSAQGIRKYLSCPEPEITVLPTVESTNDLVRQKAAAGAPEGTLVIAGGQTAGKGRSGREFFSPEGTGIYLSLLLRPEQLTGGASVGVTTLAAAAMCQAVERVTGRRPGIKWVNDIFLDGKKICGILTEGSFSMETGMLQYAVLGVGVNVYSPEGGFPEELKDVAGVLAESRENDLKNRLTAEFLNSFYGFYRGNGDYTRIYREYSIVIGREVAVLSSQGERRARVLGIDDACRLQLEYDTGETDCLSYGEIRIRI